MATPVIREVTIEASSTVHVTATIGGQYDGTEFTCEFRPIVDPSPVGFINGPVGRAVSSPEFASGTNRIVSGALTFVATLAPGTYDIGVDVFQSASGENVEVSVSIVVGCDTGDMTIYSSL